MNTLFDILPNNTADLRTLEPVIVSASRSTDIPAFHADWFMERMRSGFTVWTNPFNRREMRVCLKRVKVVVFWTKNPAPLLPHLVELDRMGVKYLFHFTLNDYENEGLEPNVPPLAERVDIFRRLSEMIGRERVIWRFDPVLLTTDLSVDIILRRMERIGDMLANHTNRLVFSFVDIAPYRKVAANIKAKGVNCRELSSEEMEAVGAGLGRINRRWNLDISTCAEAVSLEKYGIRHGSCIDGRLLSSLFADDAGIMQYLQENSRGHTIDGNVEYRRDRGQRLHCCCIKSKDIGRYDTCLHACAYCYANRYGR
jgi:DNA repair photolyase